MSTFTEFATKSQEEFLTMLQQAQERNLAAMSSLSDLVATVPGPGQLTAMPTLPTPAELVEQTFAFTSQVLEARKDYMLKLAEIAGQTQKQLLDAATRASAKN